MAGLYPQIAFVHRKEGKLSTRYDSNVRVHHTAALLGDKSESAGAAHKQLLAQLQTPWLVYEELARFFFISIVFLIIIF